MFQSDGDGIGLAGTAPAAFPKLGSVTEFCFLQSRGGAIAAAAEAPSLKATPGVTVRNDKASAESAVGGLFCTPFGAPEKRF